MIVLKIGNERFRLPESRKDVTIRQMLQYHEDVMIHMPGSMKRVARYYKDLARIQASDIGDAIKEERAEKLKKDLDADLQSLTAKEKPDEYMRYYAKALSFFGGIDERKMLLAKVKDLEKFYSMLITLINTQKYDEAFDHFDFKGESYHLPQRMPVPMENSSLIEFLEAEQYRHYYRQLEEGDGKDDLGFDVKSHYNALVPLVCILARKKDEQYYDKIVDERSDLFLDLPVYYADQVFFYIARWSAISMNITDRLLEIGSALKTSPQVQES